MLGGNNHTVTKPIRVSRGFKDVSMHLKETGKPGFLKVTMKNSVSAGGAYQVRSAFTLRSSRCPSLAMKFPAQATVIAASYSAVQFMPALAFCEMCTHLFRRFFISTYSTSPSSALLA